jgi:hypothetical protein
MNVQLNTTYSGEIITYSQFRKRKKFSELIIVIYTAASSYWHGLVGLVRMELHM